MATNRQYEDLSSSDIPFLAMGNHLHIEVFGNKRIAIDGSFSIIEYSEECIKLKCKKNTFQILGVGLMINNVSDENLLVTGKIITLEFID